MEKSRIDREGRSVVFHDEEGSTSIPSASLALLIIGPGCTITHNAITTLADDSCQVVWTGQRGVKMYAHGTGLTGSSRRLLHQAKLAQVASLRLDVVRRMYEMRFGEKISPGTKLNVIRGKEGVRIRECYRTHSARTGVEWKGRNYSRTDWEKSDLINRALSVANSCLYGICHAAIVAAGYSAAIGFIHTGRQLSFVYDIADLYKTEITIPAAFDAVLSHEENLEKEVRIRMRDCFAKQGLLDRILPDIDKLLRIDKEFIEQELEDYEVKVGLAGHLWGSGEEVLVPMGVNYADLKSISNEGVGSVSEQTSQESPLSKADASSRRANYPQPQPVQDSTDFLLEAIDTSAKIGALLSRPHDGGEEE